MPFIAAYPGESPRPGGVADEQCGNAAAEAPAAVVRALGLARSSRLYRLSGGRFLWTTSNKRGWGALRLTTIGRKSGQERSVIVGYLEDGPNLVAIAMNGWDEGHPGGGATSRRTRTPSFDCRTSSRARCAHALRGGGA